MKFREIFAKVISDKHEDVIAKFGATLAQGILDAGEYFRHASDCISRVLYGTRALTSRMRDKTSFCCTYAEIFSFILSRRPA